MNLSIVYLRPQVKNAPTAPEEIAQLAAAAEAERVVYDRLKGELRTAAAVLAALCFAACYGFYGRVSTSDQMPV